MAYVPVEHRYMGEKLLTCSKCGYVVLVVPLEGQAVLPEADCPVCRSSLSESALTRREKEVVGLMAEGYSTKEIAGKLSVSPKTVEAHRLRVFKKLNIKDVANLTKYALEHGFTTPEVKFRG